MRKKPCAICQTEFEARLPRDLYCSDDCRTEGARRAKRARYHKKPREWKDPKPCEFCKKPFTPVNRRQRACPKPECKRALELQKWGGGGPPQAERPCPICKEPFTPKREGIKTCGADYCKDTWRKEQALRSKAKAAEKKLSDLQKSKMEDPFPGMTHCPPEVTGWDCAAMDPLTSRYEFDFS